MLELFDNHKSIEISQARNLVLVDTCFFVWMFEHNKIKDFEKIQNKAMTSFNILELNHNRHKFSHYKHHIRHYLENESRKRLAVFNFPLFFLFCLGIETLHCRDILGTWQVIDNSVKHRLNTFVL